MYNNINQNLRNTKDIQDNATLPVEIHIAITYRLRTHHNPNHGVLKGYGGIRMCIEFSEYLPPLQYFTNCVRLRFSDLSYPSKVFQ